VVARTVRSLCDGEWEHGKGIRIETLDNPGWALALELDGTDLEEGTFETISIRRTEDDWVDCRIEGSEFRGFCGPNNLQEVLEVLQRWVEQVRLSGGG
jgi:hypothetical protein